MTGPWINQFSLIVNDLSDGIESLKCVMTTTVKSGRVYKIYSDGVSINKALNQITCFFKKEILYQTTYCIEFHISTPIDDNYETSKCVGGEMIVYHVPTINKYTEV
jgi:hypothetical protein